MTRQRVAGYALVFLSAARAQIFESSSDKSSAASQVLRGASTPATSSRRLDVDSNCALTGFWEVNEMIVARLWKAADDYGYFQFVGRGQCANGNGNTSGSWYAESGVDYLDCKTACEESDTCTAFEVTELGACYLRYRAANFDNKVSPASWLTSHSDGDLATGQVSSTVSPYDRYCYRKYSGSSGSGSQASNGGYWRAMFFPKEEEVFEKESKATKEVPLTLTTTQPSEGFSDCGNAAVGASAPFTSSLNVWWGLRENNFWAGIPSSKVGSITYQTLNDIAAWDQTIIDVNALCPIAKDLSYLTGQWWWTLNGFFGVGDCLNTNFARLSADFAALTASGWNTVKGEDFRYGIEVYLRRMLFAQKLAVADEACFKTLHTYCWTNRASLTYSQVQDLLAASDCMTLIP
mmetsp:Transcript_83432/g.183359  ORF Transcript_83432/g.183359 Transcript_83432/m.183359 type:complete len:406 (-) Transcript_83432:44-1261(-)